MGPSEGFLPRIAVELEEKNEQVAEIMQEGFYFKGIHLLYLTFQPSQGYSNKLQQELEQDLSQWSIILNLKY